MFQFKQKIIKIKVFKTIINVYFKSGIAIKIALTEENQEKLIFNCKCIRMPIIIVDDDMLQY